MRWADSARSDNEFEVARAVTNFVGYWLQFVRNYDDALKCHTDFSQFTRREIGIGVVHFAEEDFVSYHHHPAITLLHRGNLHFWDFIIAAVRSPAALPLGLPRSGVKRTRFGPGRYHSPGFSGIPSNVASVVIRFGGRVRG